VPGGKVLQKWGILLCKKQKYTKDACGAGPWSKKDSRWKMLPLQGVVHDIGRSITHKVKIIKMHVSNYSTKDIARSTSHASSSVDRYIRDFQRIKMLYVKGMALAEIAYITSLSESLVNEYIKIVKEQMLKNKFYSIFYQRPRGICPV